MIASAGDISWAFYLDAVSFAVSAFLIYRMRLESFGAEERTSASIVLGNLKAGAQELFSRPILRSLFTMQAPVVFAFGLVNALLLPFALRALGATEFQYGIQEGLTSLGFVVGSLLMAATFDRMREASWMFISFLGMGIAAHSLDELTGKRRFERIHPAVKDRDSHSESLSDADRLPML